jgi:hypothetical protein
MTDVAVAEGLQPSMGQSPFAIARGQTFEKSLFRDNAAALFAELQRSGVLPSSASGFVDLRLRLNGGRLSTLDDSRARTSDLLRDVAAAGRSKGSKPPALIAGATICVPGGVMLPEAILVIDALVVRPDQDPPQLVVGEIKTYPDRGGYTDRIELATARAQAGVYVHGLRVVLDQELKLAGQLVVADTGFLVLSRPGYSKPSVRAGEELRYQAERAARGFDGIRRVADTFDGELYKAPPAAQIAAVRGAATAYEQECWAFCDRVLGCQHRALASGNPAVLGDDVVRFLSGVSLTRAGELLDGAKPTGPAETDLVRRLEIYRNLGGLP